MFFAPVVSGSETALVTGSDWSRFPLSNLGIISIPAGCLLGWLGTITSKEPDTEGRYTELGSLPARARRARFTTDA